MTGKPTAVQFFVLLQLYISFKGAPFIGASIRSADETHVSRDSDRKLHNPPSDQNLNDKIKSKIEKEHHYYLPTESASGSADNPSVFGASATSPPRITIDPASVYSIFEPSADPLSEQDSFLNDDYIIPYASHCVSDLPPNAESEYLSELLAPSKKLVPEPVVLSARIGIVAKTSNDNGASKKLSKASDSSDILQGSHIYMPSVTESE